MTIRELESSIENINSEISMLSEELYDTFSFKIKRNNVIATAMIKLHNRKIIWIGGHSENPIPQHWLYHLLELLEQKYPDKYEKICESLELSSYKDLFNEEKDHYITLTYSPELLYNLLVGTMNLLVNKNSARVSIGTKVQQEQNEAITSRRKEIIDLGEQLKICQLSLVTLNNVKIK